VLEHGWEAGTETAPDLARPAPLFEEAQRYQGDAGGCRHGLGGHGAPVNEGVVVGMSRGPVADAARHRHPAGDELAWFPYGFFCGGSHVALGVDDQGGEQLVPASAAGDVAPVGAV